LKPICCIALAEKVETNEQLESLKKNGFLLFQGFYLDRPKVLRCATTEYANTESFELLIEVIQIDYPHMKSIIKVIYLHTYLY
ncbi:hypothetical protein B2J67_02685, partial [Vibrio cholerae]